MIRKILSHMDAKAIHADLLPQCRAPPGALMLAVINERIEIVRIPVHAGANTELKGSNGTFKCTPIEYARKHGNDEIIDILSNCAIQGKFSRQ